MSKPVTVVYLPDEYEIIGATDFRSAASTALIPLDCFDGPVKPHTWVRVHRFDPDLRAGFGVEYDGYATGWVAPEGGDRVGIVIDWTTVRDEPDWPVEKHSGGSSNHLTFRWRWQWHPTRTLDWSWFQRLPLLRGTDEFCNKSIEVRVPFGAVTFFWKRPYRTKYNGRCEECLSK